MSTTVSYKGSTIATVNNNTKTLTTAGKYLEADVILTDSSTTDTNGYARIVVIPQQTVTPTSNGTYYQASLLMDDVLEEGSDYIITYNGTEYFFTCVVLWGTDYLLGEANYFFGSTGHPYPFGIIWTSGSTCALAVDSDASRTVKVEKVVLSGSPINLTTKTITQNGTYDADDDSADGYSSVTVNVSGGSDSTRTTIVPEQSITAEAQYNIISNYAEPLIEGEEYYCTVDGVEYGSFYGVEYYGSIAIGSRSTNGWLFEYDRGMYFTTDSSLYGTHTIKVEKVVSGGSGGDSATLITKTISANGTYSASDDSADGYSSVTVSVPTGSGKNIQYNMGRYEVSSTSYTATNLSITVSKAGTYKCYWVMDRNTTSGTSGSQLYKNGEAVGSAHTSWTYNGNNRNGISCEETLTLAANDVLVARARSRNTSYICGVSNLIIIEQ